MLGEILFCKWINPLSKNNLVPYLLTPREGVGNTPSHGSSPKMLAKFSFMRESIPYQKLVYNLFMYYMEDPGLIPWLGAVVPKCLRELSFIVGSALSLSLKR